MSRAGSKVPIRQDVLRSAARVVAPYLPRKVVILARYPREFAYLRDWETFESDRPSVLFFTTNKTASKLLARILRVINRRLLGLTPLNLAGYLWDGSGNAPVADRLNADAKNYFRDRGILYLPLREAIDTSHLKHAKCIGFLRDPRDQIVSAYKGAFTHRPPLDPERRAAFLSHRAELQAMSIEDYVLAYGPSLAARYRGLLNSFPRSALFTYEALWRDPGDFYLRLGESLGVALDPRTLETAKSMTESYFSLERDGRRVQWAIGRPGTFSRDLDADVAERLSDIFSDVLYRMYGTAHAPR